MITDGEDEEEEDEDNEDGEKADLWGGDVEEVVLVVVVEDKVKGRGLLIDRSTGSVCVWKCRS